MKLGFKWFTVDSLLSCMVKYKDASKDQSNLIRLKNPFFETPCMFSAQLTKG